MNKTKESDVFFFLSCYSTHFLSLDNFLSFVTAKFFGVKDAASFPQLIGGKFYVVMHFYLTRRQSFVPSVTLLHGLVV